MQYTVLASMNLICVVAGSAWYCHYYWADYHKKAILLTEVITQGVCVAFFLVRRSSSLFLPGRTHLLLCSLFTFPRS